MRLYLAAFALLYFCAYLSLCQKQCPKNCLACAQDGACTLCKEGFNGDACDYNCPENCKTCIDETLCLSCKDGFYGDTCTSECHVNCVACSDDIWCTKCKDGFMSQIECEKSCHKNCKSCHIDYSYRCTECAHGKCVSCEDGYFGSTCNSSCPANCLACAPNGKCTLCKEGFYGDACDNPCPENCKNCPNETLCSSCIDGFYGDTCTSECPVNCVACSDDMWCTKCKDGFTSPIECEESCHKNCKSCNIYDSYRCTECAHGQCMSCKDGHFGSTCNTTCPVNCLVCAHDETCSSCKEGFYGDACDNTCPENCKTCTNGTLCSSCIDGFYGKTCKSECPINCVACSSDILCTKCKDGFTDRYKCRRSCHENCKSCQINSYYTCVECARGRYSNDWNVPSNKYSYCNSECPKYCIHGFCNESSGECSDGCVDGYTGSKCCHENCRTGECIQTGDCSRCKSNLNETKCQCGQTICLDSKCTSCKSQTMSIEWYPKCCKCSSTCKNELCNGDGKCSEGCIDGFYGDLCEYRCMDLDINCLLCNNTCTKCISGFYPDKLGKCVTCPDKCISNTCNVTDGICIEGCIKGYWGKHCGSNCSDLCLECDKNDGLCNVCKKGRFKRNCSGLCTDRCLPISGYLTCDINTGACKHGCSNTSRYGDFCDKDCSHTCVNTECDWKTGSCTKGCISQYNGRNCQTKCAGYQCSKSILDEETSTDASLIGVYTAIPVITIIGIFVTAYCVQRRRKINQRAEHLQSNPTIAMENSTRANPRQQPVSTENEESGSEHSYEDVDNPQNQYETLNEDGRQQPSCVYQSLATEIRTNTRSDSMTDINAEYVNLRLY